MRYSQNPWSSVVIAAATLLSLLPLAPLVRGTEHLPDAALVAAGSALVGVLLTLAHAPRLLILAAQILAVGGIVAWRGMVLASSSEGVLETLSGLTSEGIEAIRSGAPPVEPVNGIIWLLILLTGLTVLVLELLVNALEQPAWAIAPIGLVFGVTAITVPTDLPFWYAIPVVAGYLAVLLSATGVPEPPTGKARPGAFLASRVQVAVVFGVVALVVGMIISPMIPLGTKQPWNSGPDGPIQLSDPTVRLEQDLRRPADSLVLTYRTSDGRPAYMRTVALPELTSSGARLLPMRLSQLGMSGAYSFPGDAVEVQVTMAGVPSEYLPAPFAVEAVDAAGEWSYDPDTMAVIASGPDRLEQTIDLSYTVVSTIPSPSREQIEQAQAGAGASSVTSEVPDGLDPAVAALVEDVVGDAGTAGEKALAIQSFLRSSEFAYTLDAPSSTGSDAISTFLLDDRAGYCVHFAAGMIAMARIEGIPARMAVGFAPGEELEDGSFQVTAHDAHAWPELFLDGLGWVPFEPTPAYDGPTEYTDPASGQAGSASPTPSPTASQSVAPTEGQPSALPTPTLYPETPTGATGPDPRWVIGGLLALLVVVSVPGLVRLGQRMWRLRRTADSRAAASSAWREVEALVVDLGQRWPQGSPGPVAAALSPEVGERAGAMLREIARTVEVSQFSREGTDTSRLPGLVAGLRTALMREASPAQRARAMFFPRSVTRWRTPS